MNTQAQPYDIQKDGFTRFLEVIPAILTYIIILIPIIFSFLAPTWVAFFIIAFDLYWLFRAVNYGMLVISSYRKMRRDRRIDWISRLRRLSDNPQKYLKELEEETTRISYLDRGERKQEVISLNKAIGENCLADWKDIIHLIVVPTYKEPIELLETNIQSYLDEEFPNENKILILGFEERAGEDIYERGEKLKKKFKGKFKDFILSYHPDGIVGELKGKGANCDWMIRKVFQKYLRKHKEINKENILVSIFDSDTRVTENYFSYLTYKYLITPERNRRGYQPIPLYLNNIWDVPMINRIVAFSSSFWQMVESCRPHRLTNFSSQTLPYRLLEDIDFLEVSIVSEDSRHYYRAFFKYSGDYAVVPLYMPVYMDAVLAENFGMTLVNQYKQKRRWAWGIEHFPYLVKEIIKHKEISFLERLELFLRMFIGNISWSTSSLILLFAGWLPFLANPYFGLTVVGFNAPRMARWILGLAWIGLIISTFITFMLLPKRPPKYKKIKVLEMVVMWLLSPISAIFFGSIPAIDAQTRLLAGKQLGFWVTPKVQAETQKIKNKA